MAKRQKAKVFSFQGFDNAHYKTTAAYTRAVNALFDKATEDIANVASKEKFNPDKPFSFDDYPKAKSRLQTTLKGLAKKMQAVIETGSRREWLFACQKNDEFLSSILDTTKLTKARLKKMQDRNLDALQAFQDRKVGGMNLSERVWKYTEQYKEQIEVGLDAGLGEGRSAQQLSRDLRQNLKDPDRLFRRVRDKRGNLHLSKVAKAFHPGTGVYRSSYKNALRLARSEINMAYRESDHLRWQQLDFVVGFEVHRSNHEPMCKCSLCERLVGKYPKSFVFKGWHPQCLCYATAILMDEEGFDDQELSDLRSAIKGTAYKKLSAKNEVRDFPDEFKAWVKENAPKQARWKSTPYFIKDNFVDGDLTKGLIYLHKPKPLTILEKAAIRHEQRTQEQIQEIQKRWDERKKKYALIKKTAGNVLNVAKDYSDVEYSLLQSAIDAGDLNKMRLLAREVAKAVSDMKKQEQALSDLIQDVHKWHKQFSISELHSVYDAVEKKLASFDGLSLDKQLSKLKFEVSYVENPAKFKQGAKKHSTWEVAQGAYKMHLAKVQYTADKKGIEESAGHSLSFAQTTKSAKVKKLASELKSLLGNNAPISELQAKAEALNGEVTKLEATKIARDLKKMGKLGNGFTPEAYTQERKDKAVWCKSMSESKSKLLKVADEIYSKVSSSEEASVYAYTAGSGHINRPLRGYDKSWYNFKGIGKVPLNNEHKDAEKRIADIERVINRSVYPTDIWVQRGVESNGLCSFLGIKSTSELPGCVGKVVTDTAFMSCGAAKGTGFGGYILNIYCPMGTKMLYIDGRSAFPNENEILLQRNTSFRVTKVNGMFIDLEVVSQ